ncbi:hypothetical protein KJS94_17865 [Flavihumibacter rivuli]|uniref:hypothetical protein n=1 Tax=Flavihumibacter rivuli TaxID=2838156 RepID=UPI001BDF1266|nr:hypothetical protein [Flavihumibacter rivuli]ULQ56521.1 hypothetical protein KJS94_17865 [Flavihumibacter rivuli]
MVKNLFAIALFAGLGYGAIAQTKPTSNTTKSGSTKTPATGTNKYNDNVDDRMKGPNGEKIYIGPNGGRYYLKNGKKVYVEYKGNKKKS